MTVKWSEHALEQVEEIFAYIVRDRPNAAVDIVDGLFETTDGLGELPEMGSPYPPANDPNVRFILFSSYRIVYRVEADRVFVSSVRHTRQDIGQAEDETVGPRNAELSLTSVVSQKSYSYTGR